jgi:hypothetical protein
MIVKRSSSPVASFEVNDEIDSASNMPRNLVDRSGVKFALNIINVEIYEFQDIVTELQPWCGPFQLSDL